MVRVRVRVRVRAPAAWLRLGLGSGLERGLPLQSLSKSTGEAEREPFVRRLAFCTELRAAWAALAA